MRRSIVRVLFLLVLLAAAVFRLYGLNWDGGIGAHPDERYLVGVSESLRWPHRLNPLDVAPDYAYGHLPVYLLALVRSVVRGVDPLLMGRGMAALFDLGVVALTFALGRQVYGQRIGLLAAAFVALMVLHVQYAHFYTADGPLAFFVLAALLFAARVAQSGRPLDAWLAGISAGLALGAKLPAALLVVPLGAACGLASGKRRRMAWRCGAATLVAFALANPFLLLGFPTFWRNVVRQASIVRGTLDVAYTRQYHATWPYVYPIVQQLRWGMGWALGLAAFGGLAYVVWRAVREPPRRSEWVLLAWMLSYFAFVGALYVKFPRYLLPLTPLLAICAACSLSDLSRQRWKAARALASLPSWPSELLLLCSSTPLLICAFLRCLALVTMYRAPHPWLAASAWFYRHADSGAVIAVEEWDHPLPLDATSYEIQALPVFAEDTPETWDRMEEVLTRADYVVIASRRGYATLARWPERYPRTARYYERLFGGTLGFESVACFGRYPRLGPWALVDDPTRRLGFSLPEPCISAASPVLHVGRLDESFVVYDHPQTILFERAGLGSSLR